MKKSSVIWISLLALCAIPAAQAQRAGRGGGGAAAAAASDKPEEGIPVTDALTISKCGTCHAKDEKGNLGRISWERSTPEGWEEAIKRMVRLNGLTISPAEARSIVKYLATHHGLAPEEAKPVMYMPEHRMLDAETIFPTMRFAAHAQPVTRSAGGCRGVVPRLTGSISKTCIRRFMPRLTDSFIAPVVAAAEAAVPLPQRRLRLPVRNRA